MIRQQLARGVELRVTTRSFPDAQGLFGFNLATHVEDDPAAVAWNRALLSQDLGLSREPVWLDQYHGRDVVEVTGPQTSPLRADGAFTREPGLPLVVLTADCLPIVLFTSSEVSVIHAGWRGLAAGIIRSGAEKFSAQPSAWIGPGIDPALYEVDDAVAQRFVSRNAFQPTAPGHYQFNLAAEAARQLAELGIGVTNSNLYTGSDERFYSHRCAGPTGRFATLVWLSE